MWRPRRSCCVVKKTSRYGYEGGGGVSYCQMTPRESAGLLPIAWPVFVGLFFLSAAPGWQWGSSREKDHGVVLFKGWERASPVQC